jgi:hypothetical protein
MPPARDARGALKNKGFDASSEITRAAGQRERQKVGGKAVNPVMRLTCATAAMVDAV